MKVDPDDYEATWCLRHRTIGNNGWCWECEQAEIEADYDESDIS